jgi:hypothetical protein
MADEPAERNSLEAEAKQAIEDEARAEADAVRARGRTQLALARLANAATTPRSADARQLTRNEYARRSSVSDATVTRWIDLGMPTIPVGSTVRIDPAAADEWRRARGRHPTTPARSAQAPALDVDADLARAGLRVVGGGRSGQ